MYWKGCGNGHDLKNLLFWHLPCVTEGNHDMPKNSLYPCWNLNLMAAKYKSKVLPLKPVCLMPLPWPFPCQLLMVALPRQVLWTKCMLCQMLAPSISKCERTRCYTTVCTLFTGYWNALVLEPCQHIFANSAITLCLNLLIQEEDNMWINVWMLSMTWFGNTTL